MSKEQGISNCRNASLPTRRAICAAMSAIGMGLVAWPGALLAGAVIDPSWGRTPQALSGNFIIPEAKGRLAGSNLFHSFQRFSINSNESATFTTSTSTILNVISRVSGNAASSINGPLSLQAAAGSAPNFFFINPNGVTFGPGAQINVPASFHVSTANSLRFSDGTAFRAGAGPDNTLTVAAPESFGFLGGNGRVVFNGVQADVGAGHAAFAASSLDVSAADIRMDSSRISSPSTDVRLVATGTKASNVPLTGDPPIDADGRIELTNSTLNTSPRRTAPFESAGSIALRGGRIKIDNSVLDASSPRMFPGAITINANSVAVVGESRLLAAGLGNEKSVGSIAIRATGDITLAPNPGSTAGPILSISGATREAASQQTGDILIEGGSVRMVNAELNTMNQDWNSRPISIVSQSNLALSGSTLRSGKQLGSGGSGGKITLESRGGGDISITDSVLNSDGRNFDPAGAIRVSTAGNVTLTNGHLQARGLYGATSGPIEIVGREISLERGSEVSTTQLGENLRAFSYDIRPISIVATKTLSIDESSVVEARKLALNARNPNQTEPGEIRLITPKLLLDGTVSTESENYLPAGSVIIEAPLDADGTRTDLTISSRSGQGTISAGISNPNPSCVGCGTGAAGLVRIDAGNLNLSGVKFLSEAGASTTGQAGTVLVNAEGAASIKRARISAASAGQAGAGSVALTAGGTLRLKESMVSTDAQTSDAGRITLNGGRKLFLDNSLVSASVNGITGNAGVIAVNAGKLVLNAGFIQANTVALGGFGGNIAITTNELVPVGNLAIGGTMRVEFQPGLGLSVIQAAAPNGIPGTILINEP